MKKNSLFLVIILITFKSYTQEKRVLIFGKAKTDSTVVKDVHIFNITSRKGTITNRYGEFQIPVKVNDTLLISDIQYESQEITINTNQLNNLQLNIYLIPKINELNVVEIKEHELTGNLSNDSKNIKTPISKVDDGVLDFSKIDFSLPIILDKDEFSRSKTSNDDQLMPPSGNIFGILSFVLNPLIKEASKIGQTKRNLKKLEKQYLIEALNAPNKIRAELGDKFFIETLKIQPSYIDPFINHCKNKGIIDKYINGSKIEVIDIFIKESKPYLKKLENEE